MAPVGNVKITENEYELQSCVRNKRAQQREWERECPAGRTTMVARSL